MNKDTPFRPGARGRPTIGRREVLAFGAAALLVPGAGRAQEFPSRPIRLMVGFSPGGGVDFSARVVAPRIAEELKGSMVVENRAGASGMICSEFVAKSPPDGYTLMYTGGSAVTIAPQLVAKPPINSLTDLIPVNCMGASPLVIAASTKLGARNLAEFLALAKSRQISMGSAGVGTLTHLTIEMLSQVTGGRVVHVPYKGGGAALVDALAGHVDAMVSDIPPVYQHFQEGRLVPIAVTNDQRVDLLPQVPTMNEAVTGFTAVSWFGLFLPARTPQAIVDKISAAVIKIGAMEDVAEQLKKAGVLVRVYRTPELFRQFVASEYSRWGALVKERGISGG
jgi:tripartite-type tricarboxylate transporter receptor subunit TctC